MSLRPNAFAVLLLVHGLSSCFAQNAPGTPKVTAGQASAAQRIAAQRTAVQRYPVPDFRGRNMEQVRELAVVPGTSRPLFASITATNTGTTVASQDIPANTQVVPGQTSLRLTFAASAPPSQYSYVSRTLNPPTTVMVPNLIGDTLSDVSRTLEGLHLKPNITGDRGGTVQRQDPAPNTSVNEGTAVTVVFAASVRVPSVTGLTVGDARQVLAGASLRPGAVRPLPAVDDRVTDQSPQAGASVPSGSQVNLTTVHPQTGLTVPSLIGDTQPAAVSLLTKLRLTPNLAGDSSGTVFRQTPPAGTTVNPGATVTIYLHALHVPKLVGLPLGQALRTLTATSLQPGSVGPTTGENDLVIAQDTPPGTDVVEGARIGLTTRAPRPLPITVPSLIGDTLDTAQSTLQSLQLTSSYDGDAGATVRGQFPQAGAQVDRGTLVALQMAVRNVQVPNVVSLSLNQAAAQLRKTPLQLGSVVPSHDGNYRVASQSPRAGATVPQNTTISLVTVAPPPPPPQQQRPPVVQPAPVPAPVPAPTPVASAGPDKPPANVPAPAALVPPPADPGNPQTPLDNPGVAGQDPPPPSVQVPDLVTNKLNDAAVVSTLASAHLIASFTGPLGGIAVWQDPPANLWAQPGATVHVQLEVPRVEVPNLRRDDAPTALQTLSSKHLQGSIQPARWAFLGPEKVVDQDPVPGSMADEGSNVHVVMGSKPRPIVYVALIFLAGMMGLGLGKLRLPHPASPPAVCTLSPETVVPEVKVRSTGPGVRYAITLRDREVETRLTIKDPPSVTELR
jgi:beta-lactam-binding protein with PASTA domain